MFPLWERPTLPLAQAMIESGLEAYLATVDLKKLPAEFAGRKFDAALLADLPEGVDPCGENGEFHTCVVAGPMFSRRLAVVTGERVERDGYAYCDLVMENVVLPSRSRGRVDARRRRAAGWGDSPSFEQVREVRGLHLTPSHIPLRSCEPTLPLRGG